jgi:hypothetical protein
MILFTHNNDNKVRGGRLVFVTNRNGPGRK